jgi:dTDP-4-dehydrorhamnose reductase
MVEIWGGIECTINRVGDNFFDQLELNGHYKRPGDIKAIANLGIRCLRYPLLWEKHQPKSNGKINWAWSDKKLNELRENNIVPIAGLLHHGSGPAFTDLLKEDFPERLAAYALEVATRYPWIEYYTPVNEPLTTARFSGLYGHWYPHKNNDVSFVKILLNELKAVVLCMHEIRKINPAAKLVQTEDLGKTYSSPLLEYQARFENHRRWLTYDLLCGQFNELHALWSYFERLGITREYLDFFLQNPCPPDIIGVNHYITSERYLDENLERFPPWTTAGNNIHQYADVEAVRVQMKEPVGVEVLLKEIWERYKIPLVITEAHLHCSRDEQLRWFKEIYDVATRLQEEGMDIKAVTAWSLFGAFGWNRLLTDMPGEYESGVFDVSMGNLRESALAGLVRALATGIGYENPLLKQKGWWHRNNRFYYYETPQAFSGIIQQQERPILVIGKNGTLGKAFSRICEHRFLEHVLLGREELDIRDEQSISDAIQRHRPWAVINAAGYVKVDEAELASNDCFLDNCFGPTYLAKKCKADGIKLLSFSSDMVFDGKKNAPYFESDLINPVNIYGQSKALAELQILEADPCAIVIRTSAFFGPWDAFNFIDLALRQVKQGRKFTAADDITISPTYVPHLVHAALDLLIDNEKGIWHLANKGALTWYEFAREATRRNGLDERLIVPVRMQQLPATRPRYSVLDSERGMLMPSLEKAMDHYFHDVKTPA